MSIASLRKGPMGLTGPNGADGPMGLQGVAGDDGVVGPQGPIGPQGNVGSTGSQGPQGTIGNTGPQGIQGPIGNTGSQGTIGNTGAQGPQGIQGVPGEIGPEGPAGVDSAIGQAVTKQIYVSDSVPTGQDNQYLYVDYGGVDDDLVLDDTQPVGTRIVLIDNNNQSGHGDPITILTDLSFTNPESLDFEIALAGSTWTAIHHAPVANALNGVVITKVILDPITQEQAWELSTDHLPSGGPFDEVNQNVAYIRPWGHDPRDEGEARLPIQLQGWKAKVKNPKAPFALLQDAYDNWNFDDGPLIFDVVPNDPMGPTGEPWTPGSLIVKGDNETIIFRSTVPGCIVGGITCSDDVYITHITTDVTAGDTVFARVHSPNLTIIGSPNVQIQSIQLNGVIPENATDADDAENGGSATLTLIDCKFKADYGFNSIQLYGSNGGNSVDGIAGNGGNVNLSIKNCHGITGTTTTPGIKGTTSGAGSDGIDGVSSVNYLGQATQAQAEAGLDNWALMTPLRTAQAIAALAASVDLTGYATETYVNAAVTALVDSSPSTLDTLNELAAALGDDANYAATITAALGAKLASATAATTYAALAGATFAGTVNTLALTVRQSGGTIGTDELQITHDGTVGIVKNMNAGNIAGTGSVFQNSTGAGIFVGVTSASVNGLALWSAGVMGETIVATSGAITYLNVGSGGYFSFRFANLERAKLTSGGEFLCKTTVEANTATSGAPNVLAAMESRSILTNEGATAENCHTLPTAAVGYDYEFACQDADGIKITAAAGDTIRDGVTVSAAAGYIRSSTIGSVIRLKSINATEWYVVSKQGPWTIDS